MIQTTRCKLTTLLSTDWDLVVKIYINAEVRRFLGGVVDSQTIRLRFQKMLKSNTERQHWVIRVEENSFITGIGIVSLGLHHNNIDTEISYQLLPEWWHKGYGTEAAQAVVNYALTVLGLSRVIAETQIDNIASCQLLERIGMHLEGTIERFGAKQGIFTITQK
ncbi:MAG: GNAT family N-acetyltransferase [Cyanobacteria bacterium P01_A01_bin.83]